MSDILLYCDMFLQVITAKIACPALEYCPGAECASFGNHFYDLLASDARNKALVKRFWPLHLQPCHP